MSSRTLAKKLASVKPGTLFVGVDLALDRNVAVVLTERAERLARFEFPNTREGYDYFYRRLETLVEKQQAPAVMVSMEPTNYIWKLLAADMERHRPDTSYHLVNAYTVKKNREGSQLDRSKDDGRDALSIADLLRTGKYTETRLLHGGYAQLRQHAVTYHRLRRDISRQKALIQNLAGQLFPELTSEFKDLTGQTATAMLHTCTTAALVRQMSVEDFIASVRTGLAGGRLMVSKLRRAHGLAAQSVGLTDGAEALQLALRCHIETLETLQSHQTKVEAALISTFKALPEAKYLLSMQNLGTITAAIILGEIGDPSHYTNARQLIKLAGTQPVPNTSGRKSRSKTPMSCKGRSLLRTTLYFAVLRLVVLDESFARRYVQLQTREQNPLTKKQALGALMNKLLRVLWALMRNRTTYKPDYQVAS